MYSASTDDSAIIFCILEPQLTAAPPKMNVKPVVERRVSWPPAQSASGAYKSADFWSTPLYSTLAFFELDKSFDAIS